MLQRVDAEYACSLPHRYTAQQLDAALRNQRRQTLQRAVQQVAQRPYLVV